MERFGKFKEWSMFFFCLVFLQLRAEFKRVITGLYLTTVARERAIRISHTKDPRIDVD